MKATTYLQLAEDRADSTLNHAEKVYAYKKTGYIGAVGFGFGTPQQHLEWALEYARKTTEAVAQVLARTDDIYLRDRALDCDVKACRAAKAASFDIDDAEAAYFDRLESEAEMKA